MLKFNSYSKDYWLLNLLQMIERLSYWVMIIQIPIYVAQKDAIGGLHFEQTTKGIIFFWWALVQQLSPVFWGGVSDKIGKKPSLFISSAFVIAGYLLLATQRELAAFLIGTLVLGFGLGTYKPALQGWIANELEGKNTSMGWGIYVLLVNLSVFGGPIVAIYLKSISWSAVFYGSAMIFALNVIFLLFIKEKKLDSPPTENILKLLAKTIFTVRIGMLILIMTGFTMTYMQFYETLPNFIFDWSDTSAIARYLPNFMLSETNRGVMVAYEWLYNLNSGLIILLVLFMAKITDKIKISKVISVGIALGGIGLFIAGFSQSGILLVLGIVCYTLGEVIINPKYPEYMANVAPMQSKSLYLGVMNISWAIGFAGGGLIGGWLYKHFAEKAHFAQILLVKNGIENVPLSQSFSKAMQLTGLDAKQLTAQLWEQHNPNLIWLPFLVLSLISIIGMYFYSKKY